MRINRSERNPLIAPKDVKASRPDFEVVCVFNAGVTRFRGEVLLLLRVAEVPRNDDPENVFLAPMLDADTNELIIKRFDRKDPTIDFADSRFILPQDDRFLTSISHLRIARSKNGIDFTIDEKPALFPANIYERFGIEDPRITYIDGTYYINYSACSNITGVTTNLASTKDFETFTRHGVIFTPDNKDIAIFPQKIGGLYYAFNRPASAEYGMRDLWISQSPDLVCWGNHRLLMRARENYWDDGRIGCGAVPFLIDEGWLEIYHGSTKDNRYCLGAVLLDKDEPWKIIARGEEPIIQPEADYEKYGFFGDVIFNCGALHEDGKVKIYYGAADTCMAYAEAELSDILSILK
ncbi:glycosidase [Clostridia bacterium]|nr:glycosidase [Clostridia bacterium]